MRVGNLFMNFVPNLKEAGKKMGEGNKATHKQFKNEACYLKSSSVKR